MRSFLTVFASSLLLSVPVHSHVVSKDAHAHDLSVTDDHRNQKSHDVQIYVQFDSILWDSKKDEVCHKDEAPCSKEDKDCHKDEAPCSKEDKDCHKIEAPCSKEDKDCHKIEAPCSKKDKDCHKDESTCSKNTTNRNGFRCKDEFFSQEKVMAAARKGCIRISKNDQRGKFPRPYLGKAFQKNGPCVEWPIHMNGKFVGWFRSRKYRLVMTMDCTVVGAIYVKGKGRSYEMCKVEPH